MRSLCWVYQFSTIQTLPGGLYAISRKKAELRGFYHPSVSIYGRHRCLLVLLRVLGLDRLLCTPQARAWQDLADLRGLWLIDSRGVRQLQRMEPSVICAESYDIVPGTEKHRTARLNLE